MHIKHPTYLIIGLICFSACTTPNGAKDEGSKNAQEIAIVVEAEDYINASEAYERVEGDITYVEAETSGWLAFDVPFDVAGRYQVQVHAKTNRDESVMWLEDHFDNTDGRTYNVTGNIVASGQDGFSPFGVDGSPFNRGVHKIKLHLPDGDLMVDKIIFSLMKPHDVTPINYTQSMDGNEWQLVWADEFDGEMIDTSKWTYAIGNWGWGNNELQYYTESESDNARVADGNLVIEARKDEKGEGWTSARLTTRGKQSFQYGKIEFRAQVPRERGNWAAGWTLGDAYVDEKSWPYCGEIDILESVGYEVDNESGDGIAHATVHTPAYYFKINNQISSTKDIKNIAGAFHTYAVEWTPTEVRGYVDGEQYYLYDKNADELEWPFAKPQNIILNLAMGGGWGGAQGMDSTITSQKFLIDYVRVYDRK